MFKVDIRRIGGAALLGISAAVLSPASAKACVAWADQIDPSFPDAVVCPGEGVLNKPNLIYEVLNRTVEHAFGLDGGGGGPVSPAAPPGPAAAVPPFAVFASGQWARVDHDGFDISGPGFAGDGPSFVADDLSIVGSLDFDAAKHFGFEDRYGLNLGLFGGYTETDVDFGEYAGVDAGSAINRAGMFGAYGLFRQGTNYLLVSATTFIGETDVTNDLFGSTGSYDTVGYAGTVSVGRIFIISDNVRFDLRGGIMGVYFSGDPYLETSSGSQIGKSKISFGAFKFEPGIYSVHLLDNGMVLSPYARLELQQRFGYRNESSLDGVKFRLDDADFSASLSGGVNLKVSDSMTLSGEIRGKASADSTTIAGKLGLKIAF